MPNIHKYHTKTAKYTEFCTKAYPKTRVRCCHIITLHFLRGSAKNLFVHRSSSPIQFSFSPLLHSLMFFVNNLSCSPLALLLANKACTTENYFHVQSFFIIEQENKVRTITVRLVHGSNTPFNLIELHTHYTYTIHIHNSVIYTI